jgi:hypothetical protein
MIHTESIGEQKDGHFGRLVMGAVEGFVNQQLMGKRSDSAKRDAAL